MLNTRSNLFSSSSDDGSLTDDVISQRSLDLITSRSTANRLPIRRNILSIEELQIVKSMKEQVHDEVGMPLDSSLFTDYKVGRYLISCEGDPILAKIMYKKALEMRMENDSILDKLRAEVLSLNPEEFNVWWRDRCHPWLPVYPHCGETSDGDVLVWIRAGVIDPERVIHDRPPESKFSERESHMLLTLFEWLNHYIDQKTYLNRKYTYCIKLFDFMRPHDYNRIYPKPLFPLFHKSFASYFSNLANKSYVLYPEMDAAIVVANPTKGFKRFWLVGKQFATERTLAKVSVCKDVLDRAQREEHLLPFIPPYLLPRPWGGTGCARYVTLDYMSSHGDRLKALEDYMCRHLFLEAPTEAQVQPRARRSSVIRKKQALSISEEVDTEHVDLEDPVETSTVFSMHARPSNGRLINRSRLKRDDSGADSRGYSSGGNASRSPREDEKTNNLLELPSSASRRKARRSRSHQRTNQDRPRSHRSNGSNPNSGRSFRQEFFH